MVVWVVGLLGLGLVLGIELELGIGVGYHRSQVAGGGVVGRNGLGLPNRVQGEFGRNRLEIDSIDSIVGFRGVPELVGPTISLISNHDTSRHVASAE